MEPIESSETSAYNNTLTPWTYPKEKKLQSKHGDSLKSRTLRVFGNNMPKEISVAKRLAVTRDCKKQCIVGCSVLDNISCIKIGEN